MTPRRARNAAKAADIRWYIEARGISVRALSIRLGVNQTHLLRVLTGERPGSRELLESVAGLLEEMPGRRPQEDESRLINAAVHMFFARRGKFQSEIWTGTGPGKDFPETNNH